MNTCFASWRLWMVRALKPNISNKVAKNSHFQKKNKKPPNHKVLVHTQSRCAQPAGLRVAHAACETRAASRGQARRSVPRCSSCPVKAGGESTSREKRSSRPPILRERQTLPAGRECKSLDQSREGPCAPSLIGSWPGLAFPERRASPGGSILILLTWPSPTLCSTAQRCAHPRRPFAPTTSSPLGHSDPRDQPQAEKRSRTGP